jgi:hypothetical protein
MQNRLCKLFRHVKKVSMANVLSLPISVFLFVGPDLDLTQLVEYFEIRLLIQEATAKMEERPSNSVGYD